MKTENIYRNTIKMHKMMETEHSYWAFRNFVPRPKDVHWLSHIYIYIYIYIYIGTQSKYIKRWKKSSAIKQLLESLFPVPRYKDVTDFSTDVIWMSTMCAVSLANHFRAVTDASVLLWGLSFTLRTHQCYWTTERWTLSNHWHTAWGESWKYISEHNQIA